MSKENYVDDEIKEPTFKSAKELQMLIDKYFCSCEGTVMLDENNYPVSGKSGFVYEIEPKPITLSGLALALGFSSKVAMQKYKSTPILNKIITIAKSRIEEYVESKLFDKGCSTGAKFILENNFRGWVNDEEDGNAEFTLDINVIA